MHSRRNAEMLKTKPSPSIALTILALIGLLLIFTEYQICGRYHPDPYISPCQDSIASELFPNSLAYLVHSNAGVLTAAANVLFVAALWLTPWLRKRSWRRTFVSVAAYLFASAAFTFFVIYATLS